MFPMHGGFMGRKKGGSCAIPIGWRYLHDEISGGTSALSKLIVKSSYLGPSVRVPNLNNDYGFCQGIVDFDAIDAVTIANSDMVFYDQISNLNCTVFGSGGVPAYSKAANNFSFRGKDDVSGVAGAPFVIALAVDYSQPFTLMYIGRIDENPTSPPGIMIQTQTGTAGTLRGHAMRINADGTINMFVGNNSANTIIANTTDVIGTGQKLVIMTYDGSKNASGLNVYVNDMVTPLAKTASVNSLTLTTTTYNRIIWGGLNNVTGAVNGRNDERHIFNNKLLSQAERETAKEILEQYYTFT